MEGGGNSCVPVDTPGKHAARVLVAVVLHQVADVRACRGDQGEDGDAGGDDGDFFLGRDGVFARF